MRRRAIGGRALSGSSAASHSPRILAVFEDDKALELTQRHLMRRADFGEDFYPFFFFQTLEGFVADFVVGGEGFQALA